MHQTKIQSFYFGVSPARLLISDNSSFKPSTSTSSMSSAVRVSAVAKRRRLNNGTSTPGVEVVESAVTTTTQVSSKGTDITTHKTTIKTIDKAPEQVDPVDDIAAPNGNTFEPLVQAKIVKFSGIREIEQINSHALKVRLSKGQRCVVRGITKIWIRQGSVSVYGALLHESPQVYTIFASIAESLPEILAQTKIAEFQLECIPSANSSFPSTLNVPGKLGRAARSSQMTFRVVEADREDIEGSLDSRTSTMDEQIHSIFLKATNSFQISRQPMGDENTQDKEVVRPRILVLGNRSGSTSKACIGIINRLLTEKHQGQTNDQVALLDLDHISPMFACPGTASLALIKAPILGPSYTSPLHINSSATNRLICSYYVGNVESTTKPYHTTFVESLLKKNIENMPLVIRVGARFGALSAQQIVSFTTTIKPSLNICIASSRSSELYEIGKTIAEQSSGVFSRLVLRTTRSMPTMDVHRMSLQSHFRHVDVLGRGLQWLPKTGPTITSRSLSLPVGPNAHGLRFLVVHGGVLRYEDIGETLQNALVTIVASYSREHTELLRDSQTLNVDPVSQTIHGGPPSFAIELRQLGEDAVFLQHVGLAYVDSLNESTGSITLITTVSQDEVQRYLETDYELGLVLEKPSADGRFAPRLLFD